MQKYYLSYLGKLSEYLIYLFEHFPKCFNQTRIIDSASDQNFYFSPQLYIWLTYLFKNIWIHTKKLKFTMCYTEEKCAPALASSLNNFGLLEAGHN